jgi:hypothetical protein
MLKFSRQGPSSLHTGRYHHEREGAAAVAATASHNPESGS